MNSDAETRSRRKLCPVQNLLWLCRRQLSTRKYDIHQSTVFTCVCSSVSLSIFGHWGFYIIVRVFKVCLVKGEISVVVLYQCCACVSTGHDPTYLVSERKGTDGILFKVLIYNNNSSNPFI